MPIFNVGSDESTSIQDLGVMVAEIFHVDISLSKIENNYVDRYIPSIDKAKRLLNLELEFDLKKSLHDVASKFTRI
jgi:nucleoside-diphosphate-sugar epimerase